MSEHVRAGWYPDPQGRAEYRYWNGGAWTDHVSTGGDQYLDRADAAAPDVVVPSWPTPAPATRRVVPRTPLDVILDIAAVSGLVLLLVFPALAVASVPSAPRLRDTAVELPALQRSPSGDALRSVPVFIKDGTAEKAAAGGGLTSDRSAVGRALDAQSAEVFGSRGDGGLSGIVVDQNNRVSESPEVQVEKIPYPFHFAAVDAVLDRTLGSGPLPSDRVGPVNDLAGLLVLANASFPDDFPNAASVAFALYDRARVNDQCEPQLNVAFLLSTDSNPRDDDTVTEFERAAKDCPNDPTPLWLLGQFQSGRASRNAFAGQQLDLSERLSRPVGTFQKLQQQFPGSALGWAGEADALMRLGYEVDVAQPFTARKDFRRAKALYQRGVELDGDPGLAVGEARADAGLGDFDSAIAAQKRAVDKAGNSAPVQVRLIDYLERAHRFGEAADTNGGFLNGTSLLPDGTQLIAQGSAADESFFEDATDPISVGTDRFKAVTLIVGPGPGGAGGGASDFSFIPTFREVTGVTGIDRWCREWSRTRDLVAAERADQALRDFPATFTDPRRSAPNNTCEDDGGTLRAVATFETGDLDGATRGFTPQFVPDNLANDDNPTRAVIFDADQNLWRFAGNFDKASATTKQWSDAEPNDPLGPDRTGEIAFLQKDFRTAADEFAKAADRASGAQLANDQLKRGTALELAGDLAGARDLLKQADDTASALIPANVQQAVDEGDFTLQQVVLDSYNARLQAGDTELRAKDYAAAEDHYKAAREREAQLPPPDQMPFESTLRRERLYRPEVLENNEALVLVELDRADEGLDVAKKAVALDPNDPIFLENLGFAQEKVGDLDGAAASYRAALESDPTVFPAANDLGVILAKQGRFAEAVDAFRQALAANGNYSIAQFNLGLALDQQGASHALESQGQIAAATRADSSLRNQDRTFVFDDDSFFTTLDLSKPVPPTWHFASSTKRTPVAVAGVVLALLLFRLFKALAADQLSDRATEKMLTTSRHERLSRFARLGSKVPGVIAVAATVAVFVYPLTQSAGTTITDSMLLGLGIAVATLAFMRLRSMVARRQQVPTRHYAWLPSIAVGGLAALVGVGYAPLPATDDEDGQLPRQARWYGSALLGGVTLLLLVIGRVSAVPFTSDLGAVSLVMTSSALTPVEPYDGAFLEEGHAGLITAFALAGVGILLYIGIL